MTKNKENSKSGCFTWVVQVRKSISSRFERARNRLRALFQRKNNEPVTVYIPNVIDETPQRDLLIEHRQSPRSTSPEYRQSPRSTSPVSCRSYHMRPVSPVVTCIPSPESGIYVNVTPYIGGDLDWFDDLPTPELRIRVPTYIQRRSHVKSYINGILGNALNIVQNDACVDDQATSNQGPESYDSELKTQVRPYIGYILHANSLTIVKNDACVDDTSFTDDQDTSAQLAHQVQACDDIDQSQVSPMVLDLSDEENIVLDREAVILNTPEYATDIYTYLRGAEIKHRAKPDYMKRQQDITPSMRTILVDWLVEVSEKFVLHRETLFLAVNYIDRFLSKIYVRRGELQLVGAASMFLAAKYEEMYAPDARDFAYATGDIYSKQQVLAMQQKILKVLNFDISVPTTNWFCEAFVNWCDGGQKLNALTTFLAELTLIEIETYFNYTPSLTAASCLCMARYSLDLEPWPASLVKKTGYEIGHMVECLNDLHNTYLTAESRPQQYVNKVLHQLTKEEVQHDHDGSGDIPNFYV